MEISAFDNHALQQKSVKIHANTNALNVALKGNSQADGHGTSHYLALSTGGKLHTQSTPDYDNDKVKLGSADGIALYADTLPVPTTDTNERLGWLWTKAVADATKLNYYMYGNVGSSYQYTLADFKGAFATLSMDNWTGNYGIPFINVYTKPTGSGDAGAYYHTRRVYGAPLTNRFVIGEQINLYAGTKPDFNNDNRSIELSIMTATGDNLDTEEILYITLHTDSQALIHTRIFVSNLGYNLNNEIKRNIKLLG